jgi:hypothetical protein
MVLHQVMVLRLLMTHIGHHTTIIVTTVAMIGVMIGVMIVAMIVETIDVMYSFLRVDFMER